MTDDLASLLSEAILEQREQINASRIARGEPGKVELWPNVTMKHVGVVIVIEDRQRVA